MATRPLFLRSKANCVTLFEAMESRTMLTAIYTVGSGDWSNPATWGSAEPGWIQAAPSAGDHVLIDHGHTVVYDKTDTDTIGRLEIHGLLRFATGVTLELSTKGNVVVHGELEMRPSSATVKHTLTFKDVNEALFVGGGMTVLETDVGLWVHESGMLDTIGTAKNPWTRLTGSANAAATTITVEDATGWRVGDRLEIAPTAGVNYDSRTISAISGNIITLDAALTYDHLKVNSKWTAEVLNLTRNVVIQGTTTGRAHIMLMHLENAQTMKNVELAYLGPQQGGEAILGRYGLHFHMNGDATRGSVIENVVAHEIGSHVYVPHGSHGITFNGTISHNTYDDAYWWDTAVSDSSHDIVWNKAVASKVNAVESGKYTMAGFFLGHGEGNVLTNSVAVGVGGAVDSSGFTWPETGSGVWVFEDNLSHNNACDGIFTWQNNTGLHIIERFTAYNNGDNGIEHGAYVNSYSYRDLVLYGNANAGVELHSNSGADFVQSFINIDIDAAGKSDYAFIVKPHNGDAGLPTIIKDGNFRGYKLAGLALLSSSKADWLTVDGIEFESDATAFYLRNEIHADSLITVRTPDNEYFELRRYDKAGTLQTGWNARKTDLPQWLAPDEAASKTVTHSFTGTNGAAWSASAWTIEGTGQSVTIQSNAGEIRRNSASGPTFAVLTPGAGFEQFMVDSSQTVTLKGSTATSGMFGGLYARRADSLTDTYYVVGLAVDASGSKLRLVRVVNGTGTALADLGTWIPGTNYNLRLDTMQEGWDTTRLQVKLWATGTTEPAAWSIDRTDNHPALQNIKGQVGIYGKTATSSARYWRFDDYSAKVPITGTSETWTGNSGAAWPARWTIQPIGTTGVTATIDGNKGKLTKTAGQANGYGHAFLNDLLSRDMNATATFSVSATGAGFGLIGRAIDPDNNGSLDTYYFAQVISGTTSGYSLRVYKAVAGVYTLLGNSTVNLTSTTDQKMRFQVTSNADGTTSLRARMWAASGSEPGTWTIDISDSEPALQNVDGRLGLRYMMSGTAVVLVDNYDVAFSPDSMMLMRTMGGESESAAQPMPRAAIAPAWKPLAQTPISLDWFKPANLWNSAQDFASVWKLTLVGEKDELETGLL